MHLRSFIYSPTKTPSKYGVLSRYSLTNSYHIFYTQVLVDAIVNTGPREDSTRIGSQGTVRRQAVDVSPLRRVNQSISLLTVGVSLLLFVF
jgi:hypothetical protein